MLADATKHVTHTTERVSELDWPGAVVLVVAVLALAWVVVKIIG